jgi:heme A synthase
MREMTASATALPAGLAQRRFARFAWAVLGFNLLVVLWGAYVRATGSGAGCGNHWPLCNGEVILRSPALATVIEFTHRITSGLDLLLLVAMLVWAFRAFPPRHPARLGAALSMAFIVGEALLGAGLVLLQHVARNASTARAFSLSAHLVNTLTLLACIALTAWWAAGGAPVQVRGPIVWRAFASLGVLILMGVSGALAALGDTLFPAASLAEGLRQDFSPAAHLFVRLRGLHPFLAVSGGAWLLYDGLTTALRGRDVALRRLGWYVAAAVVAQTAAGAGNLLLLAPVWMQIVHLLLADALWIGLVLLAAVRLAAPPSAPETR